MSDVSDTMELVTLVYFNSDQLGDLPSLYHSRKGSSLVALDRRK